MPRASPPPRTRLRPFEAAVLDTGRRRHLLQRSSRVLVALSGGPDSSALLAALAALRDAGALAAVDACHVDHGLRPDAHQDAEACRGLCRGLAVPLRTIAVSVPRTGNLQAAARRVRYAALREAADAVGATCIATGHTRSDQAETVLLRLLRGSGARGLSAIPPRRGAIVRPLIDRSRGEVVAYLRERGLGWRDDPTNATPRFLRNRVRAVALPVLEGLAPGLERRLAQAADLLRQDERALDGLASAAIGPRARRAEVAVLLALPVAVRRRALRRLWRAAAGTRRGLGAEHVAAALKLLRRRGPGRLALPGGLEARVAYGAVEVGRPAPAPAPVAAVQISRPGSYRIPGRGVVVDIGWRSGDPPPWPVQVRTRLPGDRFRPAGAPGGKKLKAWLIDRKIPRAARDALLLVTDAGGSVLSVPELGAAAAGAAALEVVVRPAAPDRPSG